MNTTPYYTKIRRLFASFKKNLRIKINKYNWEFHFYVFVFSLCFSVSVFIILMISLHLSFKMPNTTAINWFTVHKYPKQQDIFYFIFGFPFILVLSIIIWMLTLWVKKR